MNLNEIYFMRIHFLAIKYATLSEGEYRRIITCTFEELIEVIQNSYIKFYSIFHTSIYNVCLYSIFI